MVWVFKDTTRPFSPLEITGTHCIGGWVGPVRVWTGAENLASTGIRSPDCPASSESLYQLSYPGIKLAVAVLKLLVVILVVVVSHLKPFQYT
jgi:hypothetical protein